MLKKIHWRAIVIGFLAWLGTLVVELVLFALFLYLIGVPVQSMRAFHADFPGPLTILLLDLLYLLSFAVAGYVSALLGRPEGPFHAFVLGLILTVLPIFLGGLRWIYLLIIPCCLTGALFTRDAIKK